MDLNQRVLAWEGCKNVRDLGGLRTADGRSTRWGEVVRADHPARLAAAGWRALYDYGIRTIITLRTHGMAEDNLEVTPPNADITVVQAAIEDVTNLDFVRQWASTELWSTPLYYPDALRLWPERHAAAITAIARAGPGGVLFHCVRGVDRTGIIALLLLSLAGVTAEDILADYALSHDPDRDELLASRNTSVREVLLGVLQGLEVESYLRLGGASEADLAAVRRRLVG